MPTTVHNRARPFIDRLTRLLDVHDGSARQREVAALLDALQPEDFGLGPRLPLSAREPVRQEEVFSNDTFSVGLFMLAAGQGLPLHDHPRMTVWLKVIRGTLRVRSYDWVEKDPHGGWARQVSDRRIEPPTAAQVLLADSGNLHEIHALEDTAFIDLFSPYYAPDRPCSYYRPRGLGAEGGEGLIRLDRVPEGLAR